MSFRTRLLVTFLLAVIVPMVGLALFIRAEMTERITSQYEQRVDALIEIIERDIAHESRAIARSLHVLRDAIVEDNRFRAAAVDRMSHERRYLLDYAGDAMRLTGLDMLQVQDADGRIISSGHFRNEYDRLEPEMPRLLSRSGTGAAIVQARAPDAPFLALVRLDSVRVGSGRFYLVAGRRVEARFLERLTREPSIDVTLSWPGGIVDARGGGKAPPQETGMSGRADVEPAPAHSPVDSVHERPVAVTADRGDRGAVVRDLNIPFVDAENGRLVTATFRVAYDMSDLQDLRRSVDRWFAVALAAAGLLTIVLVSWLASRTSRPLMELATKTSRIDLDRLDVDFDTERRDEIGALSRVLDAMTQRLRTSAVLIKDAERRATLGELARQVNHDIKNGLTPIRNVIHHLLQLSRDAPAELPAVFDERKGTLDSSISYLENLAANYARISRRGEPQRCDVNAVVTSVVNDRQSPGTAALRSQLARDVFVLGDPVSLRRVIENLVDNALDAEANVVTVSTRHARSDGVDSVQITVEDDGHGMDEEQIDRVFDDFYTTREDGTGLGLSIVRRLVMDLDGEIQIDSRVGKGSRFTVSMPSAPPRVAG